MRKNMKIGKIIVSLLVLISMSVSSFAATVSDNDGSAFITKAEFDSLKNDFQSQIDQYNTSIDSKIDAAIASYLAGIIVSKKSMVRLLSEVDTTTGNGYRSRYGGSATVTDQRELDLNHRITTEWILGLSSAICYRAAWVDIDTGEVDILWADEARTVRTLPAASSPWWVEQTTWGVVKLTDGNWATAPVGTQALSGVTKMKMDGCPLVYVDKNGVVQEYSNKKAIIIDMRSARGVTGASANYRYFLLAGVAKGEKPAHYEWNINELYDGLPIACLNEQSTAAANGFGYVYALQVAATQSFNPNIFVWNLIGTTTAYDSECKKVEVNEEIACVPLSGGDYNFSGTVNRLVWGGNATGQGLLRASDTAVPYVSWEHAGKNTNLPADAFETLSGYPYGRLKLKYLQLKDFKSIESPTRNLYTYEGLPVYTTSKDGSLDFNIYIEKATYRSPDVSNFLLWDDKSSTMKIRIKDKPFTLNDDYSDCVTIKINGVESKEGTVPADTKTLVNIKVEKGKTYYMRWYCDGYDYGGEILYLGDGELTTEE